MAAKPATADARRAGWKRSNRSCDANPTPTIHQMKRTVKAISTTTTSSCEREHTAV